MILGPHLLATCEATAPLGWVRHVEQHEPGCPCNADHEEDGRATSNCFATLTIEGAQLCVYSGERMQTAYVRLLAPDGRFERVVHVPGGEHVPVSASLEERRAWVKSVVPRLLAAARALRP